MGGDLRRLQCGAVHTRFNGHHSEPKHIEIAEEDSLKKSGACMIESAKLEIDTTSFSMLISPDKAQHVWTLWQWGHVHMGVQAYGYIGSI